jgi:tetratricopeptide (TPR) repeat protein
VLGEIRLAQGDLTAAETAFRRAHELGWDPQPGYALLHAARGQSEQALRALERGLADRAWAPRQRRGTLLAHLAALAAREGQVARARSALQELDEHPDLWRTLALRALVAQARAEVALAEARSAEGVACLRQSVQLWQDVGSPPNVARVRVRLAQALAAEGDKAAAALELSFAESTFQKLAAVALVQTCQEISQSLGLPTVTSGRN